MVFSSMKSQNSKKILVTGSYGYLGSQTVPFLKQTGHDLWTVDKMPMDQPNHRCCDLSEKKKIFQVMEECKPDIVIHCATHSALAYGHRFLDSFREDSAILFHLLESLQKNPDCRLLYFSSSYVYSGLPFGQPVDEETTLRPRHPFGIAKGFFEQLILKTHPNSLLFRLFSVFGPGNTLFPNAAHQMIQECKKSGRVTIWGEGKRKMQYIFIKDVLRCLEKGLSFAPGIYNVGGNEYQSVEEAARIIAETFGGDVVFLKDKKEGESLPFGNNARLKRVCGQDSFTPFATAIREYLV